MIPKHFMSKVLINRDSGCWLWQGKLNDSGYGRYCVDRIGFRAHRMVWLFARGPIPNGINVLHSCDVRNCVNPDHLFLGTDLDNMRDMVQKGRGFRGEKRRQLSREKAPKGENHWAARLSNKDVQAIRRIYAAKAASQYALAERFGVRQQSISKIVLGLRRKSG